MNRHQRRRARSMARHNHVYGSYVRHLPRVALDAPLERGRVYHDVFFHDEWCGIYSGAECNCRSLFSRHVEPRRL
jgi:hypothetical protein